MILSGRVSGSGEPGGAIVGAVMISRSDHRSPRPVTVEIIAGTPSGGGQDRAARALAGSIERSAGVDVDVTNVPGRGGGNAWDHLAARPGDPGLLAISSPTIITNALLGKADIDERHLTPIALLCTEYIVFVEAETGPDADAGDLVARLASPSSPVTALATARGNVNHMALSLVATTAGVDPSAQEVRVFDSARDAVADVLAGRADVAAVSAASVVPEVGTGELRALAVSSPRRLGPPLQEVPTWEELGVPCTIGTWRGVVAAPGIPGTARAFWEEAVASAMDHPFWSAALERNLWSPTRLDAASTGRFHERQRGEMAAALDALGLAHG